MLFMAEIKKLAQTLEEVRRIDDDDNEYWYARELYSLLGYAKWENFLSVLFKARGACEKSGSIVKDHFPDVRKMVKIGFGSPIEVDDYKLTRYACYLIAQNGDPRKEEIAFAQMYFALQTRRQELLEYQIEEIERLIARRRLTETDKEFAAAVLARDVDRAGLAEIVSVGDYVLFGSKSTKDMKKQLMIRVRGRALADFLPTVTIKAKDLAVEATIFNTKQKNLFGKESIKKEHVRSNQGAREFLLKLDIVPERLPPSEDIKRVERRYEKHKKLVGKQLNDGVGGEELIVEISEGTTTKQLEALRNLFFANPGSSNVFLQLRDKTMLVGMQIKISRNLCVRIMNILSRDMPNEKILKIVRKSKKKI